MSNPLNIGPLLPLGNDPLNAVEEKAADAIVGYWVFSDGRCDISSPVSEKLIKVLRANGFVIGHTNVPAV